MKLELLDVSIEGEPPNFLIVDRDIVLRDVGEDKW